MQFNEQVLIALEVLRNFAENDFERHRIDVLEKDLTAPPKVEVIDDAHQKFNDVVYVKRKSGHYDNRSGIHQAVYRYYFGEIPNGIYIHHKDFNPSENNIQNLQPLTNAEHKRLHEKNITMTYKPKTYICRICGTPFLSLKPSVYCSDTCLEIGRRQKTHEKRICLTCGKEFDAYKYLPTKYCCHSCAAKADWERKRKNGVIKICAFCGKEFTAAVDYQIYCSEECNNKAFQLRHSKSDN